jgi:hypothetical protein
MQAQQQGGRFDRCRRAAVIFAGEVGEAELVVAAHFPEEFDVEAGRLGLRRARAVRPARLAKLASARWRRFSLTRLPWVFSTCSEASLSARMVPALKAPSSSNRTFMGKSRENGRDGADYTRCATAIRTSLCAT